MEPAVIQPSVNSCWFFNFQLQLQGWRNQTGAEICHLKSVPLYTTRICAAERLFHTGLQRARKPCSGHSNQNWENGLINVAHEYSYTFSVKASKWVSKIAAFPVAFLPKTIRRALCCGRGTKIVHDLSYQAVDLAPALEALQTACG